MKLMLWFGLVKTLLGSEKDHRMGQNKHSGKVATIDISIMIQCECFIVGFSSLFSCPATLLLLWFTPVWRRCKPHLQTDDACVNKNDGEYVLYPSCIVNKVWPLMLSVEEHAV